MNSYLESIMKGIGPETKNVVMSKDIFYELIREGVLYRKSEEITTVFGVPLEVDPEEIAIRFE